MARVPVRQIHGELRRRVLDLGRADLVDAWIEFNKSSALADETDDDEFDELPAGFADCEPEELLLKLLERTQSEDNGGKGDEDQGDENDAACPNLWAHSQVFEIVLENAEDGWQLTRDLIDRALEVKAPVEAMLAAGPLEDLLVNHGKLVIDRVEALARKQPTFAHLLGGVWQGETSDEVWARVQALLGETW